MGIKGLAVPIEDFVEIPSGPTKACGKKMPRTGFRKHVSEPFCSLVPSENEPTISRFVTELKVGKPLLEISTGRRGKHEVIGSTIVRRSAPCGSTWYAERKLIGVETKQEIFHDAIAKAHHSYPCTATMSIDPEAKKPILHIGGYIIREEVSKALKAG